ncbi:MAG: hypothetical protein ACYDH5_17995 [Acidimicrobiales bacterium]
MLFVVGEAGTGKSALLQAAAGRAGAAMTVVSAKGSEMEADLSFAFAEQFMELPSRLGQAAEAGTGVSPRLARCRRTCFPPLLAPASAGRAYATTLAPGGRRA